MTRKKTTLYLFTVEEYEHRAIVEQKKQMKVLATLLFREDRV